MSGIDSLLITARDAGCPEDQVRNFLSAGYVPLPWQLRFHAAARAADGREGRGRVMPYLPKSPWMTAGAIRVSRPSTCARSARTPGNSSRICAARY